MFRRTELCQRKPHAAVVQMAITRPAMNILRKNIF